MVVILLSYLVRVLCSLSGILDEIARIMHTHLFLKKKLHPVPALAAHILKKLQ